MPPRRGKPSLAFMPWATCRAARTPRPDSGQAPPVALYLYNTTRVPVHSDRTGHRCTRLIADPSLRRTSQFSLATRNARRHEKEFPRPGGPPSPWRGWGLDDRTAIRRSSAGWPSLHLGETRRQRTVRFPALRAGVVRRTGGLSKLSL